MKINIIAVGTKMPKWVTEGVDEYSKRLPSDFSIKITEIPLGQRGKNADLARAIQKEGELMMAAIGERDHVIALEVKGKPWSTEKLAQQAKDWQMSGQNIALLVGGPDGLAKPCIDRANQSWSLSPLTLPHPVVRILLTEQLYRAWSILQNHPYHR